MRYVPEKDKKAVMADMKPIYQANNEQQGCERLLEFEVKWGKKYPLSCKSWMDNWVNLSAFFEYDHGIRKNIYTNNPIEGVHRQIRKIYKDQRRVFFRTGIDETHLPGGLKISVRNGQCQSIIGDWHFHNFILNLVTEYFKIIGASERH
jgi:hypothetical protein